MAINPQQRRLAHIKKEKSVKRRHKWSKIQTTQQHRRSRPTIIDVLVGAAVMQKDTMKSGSFDSTVGSLYCQRVSNLFLLLFSSPDFLKSHSKAF